MKCVKIHSAIPKETHAWWALIVNQARIRRKKRIDCQKSGKTQKIEKYKQSLVQFIYPIVYNNVYIPSSSFSNPQNIIIPTNVKYISETEMCIIIKKTCN